MIKTNKQASKQENNNPDKQNQEQQERERRVGADISCWCCTQPTASLYLWRIEYLLYKLVWCNNELWQAMLFNAKLLLVQACVVHSIQLSMSQSTIYNLQFGSSSAKSLEWQEEVCRARLSPGCQRGDTGSDLMDRSAPEKILQIETNIICNLRKIHFVMKDKYILKIHVRGVTQGQLWRIDRPLKR